jgi:cbb3-type cytochrome oxidase maturation protein
VTLAVSWGWTSFAAAVLLGLGAWFVYLWATQSGQWKDPEEPARRLLDQDARDTVPKEPSA